MVYSDNILSKEPCHYSSDDAVSPDRRPPICNESGLALTSRAMMPINQADRTVDDSIYDEVMKFLGMEENHDGMPELESGSMTPNSSLPSSTSPDMDSSLNDINVLLKCSSNSFPDLENLDLLNSTNTNSLPMQARRKNGTFKSNTDRASIFCPPFQKDFPAEPSIHVPDANRNVSFCNTYNMPPSPTPSVTNIHAPNSPSSNLLSLMKMKKLEDYSANNSSHEYFHELVGSKFLNPCRGSISAASSSISSNSSLFSIWDQGEECITPGNLFTDRDAPLFSEQIFEPLTTTSSIISSESAQPAQMMLHHDAIIRSRQRLEPSLNLLSNSVYNCDFHTKIYSSLLNASVRDETDRTSIINGCYLKPDDVRILLHENTLFLKSALEYQQSGRLLESYQYLIMAHKNIIALGSQADRLLLSARYGIQFRNDGRDIPIVASDNTWKSRQSSSIPSLPCAAAHHTLPKKRKISPASQPVYNSTYLSLPSQMSHSMDHFNHPLGCTSSSSNDASSCTIDCSTSCAKKGRWADLNKN